MLPVIISLEYNFTSENMSKVTMQGKLFQRCTHLLYCSILSLDGNADCRHKSDVTD